MDDCPEQAWSKGVASGLASEALATNPYPADSELFLDWEGGWREGTHVSHFPTAEDEAEAWSSWMPDRDTRPRRG